jgi:disulfide bond formation protein DsbB
MLSRPVGPLQLAALALFFGAGLATILSAWGFQLIGGYIPCELCLQQRVPYYVALPLVLVLLIAAARQAPATLVRGGLILCAAVIAIGFGLAVYQAGAEWNWWQGPTNCGGAGQTSSSTSSLLAQLKKTRVVSCTDANWRMLGLSFAGWNAVATLGLAILALSAAFAPSRLPPRR